jgi:hypothetical protein
MAKQPEDLVVRILRDIQSTLADHTKMLADHGKKFDHFEERFDDLQDGMIAALGLGSHARVRDESLETKI